MIRRLTLAAVSVALAAAPALAADFEGVAEMKITVQAQKGSTTTGTSKIYITKTAIRNEIDMQNPALEKLSGKKSIKMATIQKLDEQGVVYSVNDENKTYSVMDTRKDRPASPAGQAEEKFTVKSIGRDSVAGYSCEKFLVTGGTGGEKEVCLSKDLPGTSQWLAAMEHGREQAGAGWLKALKEAGGDGFPVKMITREVGSTEPKTTMELVKIEKKALPASLFEVPPTGYKKADFFGAENLSPEQQQQVKDAQEKMRQMMEKMPPEQRKMIEDMRKQPQGGTK